MGDRSPLFRVHFVEHSGAGDASDGIDGIDGNIHVTCSEHDARIARGMCRFDGYRWPDKIIG